MAQKMGERAFQRQNLSLNVSASGFFLPLPDNAGAPLSAAGTFNFLI